MIASSPSARRANAMESFGNAAECIGTLHPGISLFAVTRGQFSMIDAIMVCLEQVDSAEISLWTWRIAEYEVDCISNLIRNNKLSSATLIIDKSARIKNRESILEWIGRFGLSSTRFVVNHAKIATIKSEKYSLLLRGSMNLNYNPRFEQFDLTEGGADFHLVKSIEAELPVISFDAHGDEVYKASKLSHTFDCETLDMFSGVKTWKF